MTVSPNDGESGFSTRRVGHSGTVSRGFVHADVPLRPLLAEAERELAAAGVSSPRFDAESLAAHVLGVPRGRLLLRPLVDRSDVDALRALVARRAAREPLQHLLGSAVLGPVEVAVGPGVFTPRPETELLLEWGLQALRGIASPLIVDLCTGSAALALALADARRDAEVHAVEVDPAALTWARRNIAEHGDRVVLHAADVREPDLLSELACRVDLLVCNPPYVPNGTPVPPEVGVWDPAVAVFGGPDGLEIIRAVVGRAAVLLRPGGALAIEHDDTHTEAVPALLRATPELTDVVEHLDLNDRPRYATAHKGESGISPR